MNASFLNKGKVKILQTEQYTIKQKCCQPQTWTEIA